MTLGHPYKWTDSLEQELEVVFYTNPNAFVLKGESGKRKEVGPKDVSIYATFPNASREILDVLGITLRENVIIQFVFARNHSGLKRWKDK